MPGRRTEDVDRRTEDVDRRTEDVDRRTEDAGRRVEDSARRGEDAGRRVDDTERRGADDSRRSDDAGRVEDDASRRDMDAGRKVADSKRREDDAWRREEDAYRRLSRETVPEMLSTIAVSRAMLELREEMSAEWQAALASKLAERAGDQTRREAGQRRVMRAFLAVVALLVVTAGAALYQAGRCREGAERIDRIERMIEGR